MKVFISHQKKDRVEAKQIADYLHSLNIDVYFDEFDKDLQIAHHLNDPKKVVEAIKKGIKNSTHMLCIISPATLLSKWVPFEVGYGYDLVKLAVLTLKGIRNSDLPEYVQTAPIIRDIYDINEYAKKHGNQYLFEIRNFSDFKSRLHPLSNIMDSIIT